MAKKDILIGLGIAIFVALTLSPFASNWPDGLEKVAEDKGFINKSEVEPVIKSYIPDYSFPGVKDGKLATSLAGVMGTLIVFGLGWMVAKLMLKKK